MSEQTNGQVIWGRKLREANRLWGVSSGTPETSWTVGDRQTDRVVSRHVVGDWLVTVWTQLDDVGRRQVREVEVAPSPATGRRKDLADLRSVAIHRWPLWDTEPSPSAGLTTRFFRETPLGALLDEQKASIWANEQAERPRSVVSAESADADYSGLTDRETRLIPLLRTAQAYARLVAAGDRRPARSWAEETGLPVRTVQDRIRRARDAGLLTRVSSGEVGGQLTEQAQALQLRVLRSSDHRIIW